MASEKNCPLDKPDGRGNKARLQEIVKQTHKCPFCPRHDGENRRRRPRDRGKNPRRD